MNRRAAITWLTAAMLFSLSCAFVAPAPLTAPVPSPPTEAPPAADTAAFEAVRAEFAARKTGLADDELDALASTVLREAREQGLDVGLVMAVMYVESRFNTYAVSPVGALGLMQIMPATGEELAAKHGIPWRGPQTLFDPLVNVKLGVAYLKQLSLRYGSVHTALAAYNWGPGHIDGRLRRGRALPTEYPQLVNDALAARVRRSS